MRHPRLEPLKERAASQGEQVNMLRDVSGYDEHLKREAFNKQV